MNRIVLIGRLTKNPELRYTQSGIATTRFTLAVPRETKNKEGNYESDFINCVAYNKVAELICQWLQKGKQIAIHGHLQTGSYEKDGQKIYTTDVIVERGEFLSSKKREEKAEMTDTEVVQKAMSDNPYEEMGQRIENERLPF